MSNVYTLSDGRQVPSIPKFLDLDFYKKADNEGKRRIAKNYLGAVFDVCKERHPEDLSAATNEYGRVVSMVEEALPNRDFSYFDSDEFSDLSDSGKLREVNSYVTKSRKSYIDNGGDMAKWKAEADKAWATLDPGFWETVGGGLWSAVESLPGVAFATAGTAIDVVQAYGYDIWTDKTLDQIAEDRPHISALWNKGTSYKNTANRFLQGTMPYGLSKSEAESRVEGFVNNIESVLARQDLSKEEMLDAVTKLEEDIIRSGERINGAKVGAYKDRSILAAHNMMPSNLLNAYINTRNPAYLTEIKDHYLLSDDEVESRKREARVVQHLKDTNQWMDSWSREYADPLEMLASSVSFGAGGAILKSGKGFVKAAKGADKLREAGKVGFAMGKAGVMEGGTEFFQAYAETPFDAKAQKQAAIEGGIAGFGMSGIKPAYNGAKNVIKKLRGSYAQELENPLRTEGSTSQEERLKKLGLEGDTGTTEGTAEGTTEGTAEGTAEGTPEGTIELSPEENTAEKMKAVLNLRGNMLNVIDTVVGDNVSDNLPPAYSSAFEGHPDLLRQEYLGRLAENVKTGKNLGVEGEAVWAEVSKSVKNAFQDNSLSDEFIAGVVGDSVTRTSLEAAQTMAAQRSVPVTGQTQSNEWRAYTPDNGNFEVSGTYDVIEAGDLLSSSDEGFNPALQPRDRQRSASKIQISEISANLNANKLGESQTTDTGAPIVNGEYNVLSGNGRVSAVRQAYSQNTKAARAYREMAINKAIALGMKPEDAHRLKNPVLVRKVDNFGEMSQEEFVERSNRSVVLKMSELEQAQVDAQSILTPELVRDLVVDDAKGLLGGENASFMSRFISKTGDWASLTTAQNTPNANAVRRVKNALLASVLGNNQATINTIFEAPENFRNLADGLVNAAPKVIALRGTQYDLSADIAQAVDGYIEAQKQGWSVEKFIAQTDFLKSPLTAESQYLMQSIEQAKRSPKQIEKIFNDYFDNASKIDTQSQGLFGNELPSKLDVLNNSYGDNVNYDKGVDTSKVESTENGVINNPQGIDPEFRETILGVVDTIESIIANGEATDSSSLSRKYRKADNNGNTILDLKVAKLNSKQIEYFGLKDPYIYTSLFDILNHHFNHHKELNPKRYYNLPKAILNADYVARGSEPNSYIFGKMLDRMHIVTNQINIEKGHIFLYKNFFATKKKNFFKGKEVIGELSSRKARQSLIKADSNESPLETKIFPGHKKDNSLDTQSNKNTQSQEKSSKKSNKDDAFDSNRKSSKGDVAMEMPELVSLYNMLLDKFPVVREFANKLVNGVFSHGKKGEYIQLAPKTAELLTDAEFEQIHIDAMEMIAQEYDIEYDNHLHLEQIIYDNDLNLELADIEKGLADTLRAEVAPHRESMQARQTLAHEIGHLIDYLDDKNLAQGNILGHLISVKNYLKHSVSDFNGDTHLLKKIRQELINLSLWWRRGDVDFDSLSESDKKYISSPAELYADAFSVLMNAPAELEARAPNFFRAFHSFLDARPVAMGKYKKLQMLIKAGGDEVQAKRMQERRDSMNSEAATSTPERQKESWQSVWDKLTSNLFDKWQPIYRRVKKNLKNLPSKYYDKVLNALKSYDYRNTNHESYLKQLKTNVLDLISKANLTLEDLSDYMFLKHIAENRANIYNPLGYTAKSAIAALKNLEKQLGKERFDVLVKAQEAWWNIRQECVLKPLRESGIFSKELMDILEARAYYAPFKKQNKLVEDFDSKIDEMIARDLGVKSDTITATIHAQIGYLGEVKNPAQSLMAKDLTLMDLVLRNDAVETVVDVLKKTDASLISSAMGENGKIKRINSENVGIITLMKNGKLEAYYVPKMISEAFQTNKNIGFWLGLFTRINNAVKMLFTQLNPGFWAVATARDIGALHFRIPSEKVLSVRNVPIIGLIYDAIGVIGSIPAAARSVYSNKDVNDMLKRQLVISHRQSLGSGGAIESNILKELTAFNIETGMPTTREGLGKYLDKIFHTLRMLKNGYMGIGQVFERAAKIYGTKLLDKNSSLTEVEKRNIARMHAGSPDFLAKGKLAQAIDCAFLFYNPIVQGYKSSVDAVKRDKMSLWRLGTMVVAPTAFLLACEGVLGSAMLSLVASMLGHDDDELMEMNASISLYDRTNYFCVPLGWDDKEQKKVSVWRIPLPEEVRILRGLLYTAARKEAVVPAVNYAGEQLPSKNPVITTFQNLFEYYVQGSNPTDSFRGRNILDETTFNLGGLDAAAALAKNAWNNLGGTVIHRFKDDSMGVAEETPLEKRLSMPVISSTLGRFLKVSNQGLKDEARLSAQEYDIAHAKDKKQINEVAMRASERGGLSDSDFMEVQGLFNSNAELRAFRTKIDKAIRSKDDPAYRMFYNYGYSKDKKRAVVNDLLKQGKISEDFAKRVWVAEKLYKQ